MSVFVGIVGSRRRISLDDERFVQETVRGLSLRFGDDLVVVSGGCVSGADRFAEDAARTVGVETLIFPIDRSGIPPGPEGKREFARRAHQRNGLIAKHSRRSLIALVHPQRTGVTESTVSSFVSWMEREPDRDLFLVFPGRKITHVTARVDVRFSCELP